MAHVETRKFENIRNEQLFYANNNNIHVYPKNLPIAILHAWTGSVTAFGSALLRSLVHSHRAECCQMTPRTIAGHACVNSEGQGLACAECRAIVPSLCAWTDDAVARCIPLVSSPLHPLHQTPTNTNTNTNINTAAPSTPNPSSHLLDRNSGHTPIGGTAAVLTANTLAV